jgi:hypothetical protein
MLRLSRSTSLPADFRSIGYQRNALATSAFSSKNNYKLNMPK